MIRKVILLCGLIATLSASFGWPTAAEIEKVKPVVEELMAAKADARPEDAAVVALEFADKAETEAAKFMLFYRAVKFYAKAGDDANVVQTFLKMKEVVKDIPATVQEQILIEAGRTISRKNRKPERTEVHCRGVRVVVWAEKELIAAQKILKAPQKEFKGTKKDVPAAHLQAGNAFAVLGDWPKALEHLCAADGKLARVAEHAVEWRYVKDDVESAGEDAAWVANYQWTSAWTATRTTPVPVPYAWLMAHDSDVVDEYEAYEESAKRAAANGWKVWECYVVGLDPQKMDKFRITSFPMKTDGTPDLENLAFEPSQDKWNVPEARPVVKGTASLDGEWQTVTDENKALFRFFKVEVVSP